MKNKLQSKNIILYAGIIIFLLLVLVLTCFVSQKFSEKNIASQLEIMINPENNSEVIKGWYNETNEKYYFFLPAETKQIKIAESEKNKFEIDGLEKNQAIDINTVNMNTPYAASFFFDSGVPEKIQIVFMQSENIPALFITTESGSMDYINEQKGNFEAGTLNVLSGNRDDEISGKITELSGRGNTSWTECEKKGYKFTLNDTVSLLGLKESENWILIANARSNYLSNSIAFWLENEMGIQNVTNAVSIDLYFNGEYAGNYILCEKISVGENSINITNLEERNELANPGLKTSELTQYVNKTETLKAMLWKQDPEDITGGYLLERDVVEYYADEKSGFVLSSGDHYVVKSPQYASVAEVEYIQNYMEELYQAVSSSDGYNSEEVYYADYIDLNSFALKYVLEEFLAFNDAGRSSAYYYKDTNDVLRAGPGWDFEGAFLGNPRYITMLNGTVYSTDFFEKLMQHEDFSKLVKEYYETRLRPAIEKLLNTQFDEFQNSIHASAEMDMIRWDRENFADNCESIKSWINVRLEFLDEQWLLEEEYLTIKVMSDWENTAYLYIQPGEKISEDMLPEYIRDGYTFLGWADSNEETFDFDTHVMEDTDLHAIWSANGRSIIALLIQYGKQTAPELCFGLFFILVALAYVIKVKYGGYRK